ncbi:unnamed protein product [Caretta caretta]
MLSGLGEKGKCRAAEKAVSMVDNSPPKNEGFAKGLRGDSGTKKDMGFVPPFSSHFKSQVLDGIPVGGTACVPPAPPETSGLPWHHSPLPEVWTKMLKDTTVRN